MEVCDLVNIVLVRSQVTYNCGEAAITKNEYICIFDVL